MMASSLTTRYLAALHLIPQLEWLLSFPFAIYQPATLFLSRMKDG